MPKGWDGVEESANQNTAANSMKIDLKAGESTNVVFLSPPRAEDILFDEEKKSYVLWDHNKHPMDKRGWRTWITVWDVELKSVRVMAGGKNFHKMLVFAIKKFRNEDKSINEEFYKVAWEIERTGDKADTTFMPSRGETLDEKPDIGDFDLDKFVDADLGITGVKGSDLPF